MSIGLSKAQIQKQLNEVFLEQLTPTIGVLSQEEISKAIAEIITKNNAMIEKHIESELKRLKNRL